MARGEGEGQVHLRLLVVAEEGVRWEEEEEEVVVLKVLEEEEKVTLGRKISTQVGFSHRQRESGSLARLLALEQAKTDSLPENEMTQERGSSLI